MFSNCCTSLPNQLREMKHSTELHDDDDDDDDDDADHGINGNATDNVKSVMMM